MRFLGGELAKIRGWCTHLSIGAPRTPESGKYWIRHYVSMIIHKHSCDMHVPKLCDQDEIRVSHAVGSKTLQVHLKLKVRICGERKDCLSVATYGMDMGNKQVTNSFLNDRLP